MKALQDSVIAGAGFDVLTNEPPAGGNPLLELELPNLIITPHVAWASNEAMQTLADQLIDNIEAFVSDEGGKFRFRAPAWAWLEARHPNFAPARGQVDASVQATRALEMRMRVKDEPEDATELLSGQVLDPQNSPLSGAAVTARLRRGGRGNGISRTTTDPDGRFRIDQLVSGQYEVTATYPGLVAARAAASDGPR